MSFRDRLDLLPGGVTGLDSLGELFVLLVPAKLDLGVLECLLEDGQDLEEWQLVDELMISEDLLGKNP